MPGVFVAAGFKMWGQGHGLEGGDLGDLVHADGRKEKPILEDNGCVCITGS